MPGDYTMEWKEEDLHKFLDLTKQVYSRATELLAQEVWGHIGREAPTVHGRLAGSFHTEKMDEYNWRIFTNVHYALYVHEGTGVHGPAGRPIVPVNAQFLAFEWQGRTWFLKSVQGQKPNPYADRAISSAEGRTQEFVQRAISEMGAA